MDFDTAIADLRSKLSSFTAKYNRMVSLSSVAQSDPALWQEYQDTKAKADTVIGSVRWINNQVDSAVSWFSDTVGSFFGLSGLRGVQGLGQLGLAWIPVAWIVGVISALVAASQAMDYLNNKLELQQQRLLTYQATGNPDVLKDPDSPDGVSRLLDNLSDIVTLGAIGAAVYFVWKNMGKKNG